jgi:integral membrane sensor domain MASE1
MTIHLNHVHKLLDLFPRTPVVAVAGTALGVLLVVVAGMKIHARLRHQAQGRDADLPAALVIAALMLILALLAALRPPTAATAPVVSTTARPSELHAVRPVNRAGV